MLFLMPNQQCQTTEDQDQSKLIYSVLANWIGNTSKPFAGSHRLSSLSEQNKSALTDDASLNSHVISWSESTILDRESDRGISDGLRKQCTSERRDGVLWTGTRTGIQWATRTTDFLPRHITTVATTGRLIEQLLQTKVSDRGRNVTHTHV